MQRSTFPAFAKRKPWQISFPVMGGAIVMAIGLGLWMARTGEAPRSEAPPVPQTSSHKDTSSTPIPVAAPEAPSPVMQEVPAAEQNMIYKCLTESDTPETAAQAMLANWNQLSPPGKAAAAAHLKNLVSDDHFEPVANIMLDEDSSREVKEIFFADLLSRTDQVKWPLLLKVMEQESNPLAPEARRMLTFLLGADFKDDWAKWRDHVEHDLLNQKQPDVAASLPSR